MLVTKPSAARHTTPSRQQPADRCVQWLPYNIPAGELADYNPPLHVDKNGVLHLHPSACSSTSRIVGTAELGTHVSCHTNLLCEECASSPSSSLARQYVRDAKEISHLIDRYTEACQDYATAGQWSNTVSVTAWAIQALKRVAHELTIVRVAQHHTTLRELIRNLARRAAATLTAVRTEAAGRYTHQVLWQLAAASVRHLPADAPLREQLRDVGATDAQQHCVLFDVTMTAHMRGRHGVRRQLTGGATHEEIGELWPVLYDITDLYITAAAAAPATTVAIIGDVRQAASSALLTRTISLGAPHHRHDDHHAVLQLPPAAAAGFELVHGDVQLVHDINPDDGPELIEAITAVLRNHGAPVDNVVDVVAATIEALR